MPEIIRNLVGNGRASRRLYTDPDIFEKEQSRIFGKVWLWLGHESQIRNIGDFFTTRMGRDRIIVARHDNGQIYAFRNRCTHRGAEVCPKRAGNAKYFKCPYHSWTFRTDGSLKTVPLRKGYDDGFDERAKALALEPVAQLDSYQGFIFGCQAPEGDDLETYLGPEVRAAFDNFIDRSPDGTVDMTGGRTVQRYRGNWKLQIENSIDLLHPLILHHSAVDAANRVDHGVREPSIEWDTVNANGLSFSEWDELQVVALPRGHCWMGGFLTKSIDEDAEKLVMDKGGWRSLQAEYRNIMVEKHGTERTNEILGFDRHNTIVYPNLFVNSRLAQIRILHPTAVNNTEQHGFIFDRGGAPAKMFEASVRMVNANNSPASIVTSDDHEVFERIQEALEFGTSEWLDWSRGIEQEIVMNGTTSGVGTNEVAMRNQHQAWANYMADA